MLMFPVSAFVAALLAWLSLRTLLKSGPGLFAVLLALCSLQSLGIALASGYHITPLRFILPITATVIPPLIWICFCLNRSRPISRRDIWPQLAPPLVALFCLLYAPVTLDAVIALTFAGYGIAILIVLLCEPDLPKAHLVAGGAPRMLWYVLGCLLILSACGDLLIMLAYDSGMPEWVGPIITLLASLTLLSIGLLASIPQSAIASEMERQGRSAAPVGGCEAEDKSIIERINMLLSREKIFLDPALTLQRLARRLHLPEKKISAAINRVTGSNFSRYINRWRINQACELLLAGSNVTEAMLGSGFNTKSNFNREFLRVMKVSPTNWIEQQQRSCPHEQGSMVAARG